MYFNDGYKNGYADYLLGLPMLTLALTSPLDGYSDGYRAGYWEARRNRIK